MLRSQQGRSRIFLPPLLKLQRKITTVRSAGGSLASQLQSRPTKTGFLVLGEAGRSKRTRPGEIPLNPGRLSRLRKLRAASGGLLPAAGGRRQRLRFAGSRSVALSSAARDLPPGTSKREGQGRLANSRREWMQGGGGERARREEGKGKNRAGEPGWQPPREESERAAGAGGAAAGAGGSGGRRGGGGGSGADACSWVAARGAAVAGSARLCGSPGWTAELTQLHRRTRTGRGRQRTQDAVPQGTPL